MATMAETTKPPQEKRGGRHLQQKVGYRQNDKRTLHRFVLPFVIAFSQALRTNASRDPVCRNA
jgi:hypothetical protein